MSGIRSFTAVLAELRDGQVIVEASKALHDALAAVQEHNRPAKVTLTLEVRQLGTKGVSDAVEVVAEIASKLPKADPASTLFFITEDGNASRTQDRQRDLALTIANANKESA
jgi:hypothetical protein